MVERIIVPLDGSELAERAIPMAAHLAQGVGATLVLVSVTPSPMEPEGQAREVEASAYLRRLLGTLASERPRARGEVLYGRSAEAIARFATPSDLIAMSTHGRSGVSRLLHGSVAAELLAIAPCPVLLLRPTLDLPAPFAQERPTLPAAESARASRTWDELLGPIEGYGERAIELLRAFGEFTRHRWPLEYDFPLAHAEGRRWPE